MARVLLVSFAGYPYTPSSLMPDNGLANLAGALLSAGHAARVLDYGTTETMARLYPRDVHRRMKPLVEAMLAGPPSRIRRGKGGLRWRDVVAAFMCDRRLQRHQRRIHAQLADQILQHVDDFRADAVGFKLWNGDGFLGTVRIARHLRRRRPDLPLFAGGPHVDWFKAGILRYARALNRKRTDSLSRKRTDSFRALVYGEGEPAIVPLAEHIDGQRALADVPNLLYASEGRFRHTSRLRVEDLDELPIPCYAPQVYPSLHAGGQIQLVTLDESRGCPGACAFCLHASKSGQRWRFKSPRRVVAELLALRRTVGSRAFLYAGSNTPGRVACGNARAILAAGLDVRYACFGHFRTMGPADMDLLRRSGCRAIFLGLESASPRVLAQAMNKRIPLQQAEELLDRMRRADIASVVSVIYPAPFEDADSRQATLDFLLATRPDSVPVQFPGLIPGTRWYRRAREYGFDFPRGRAHARRVGLTYKIKLLYPPRLWPKLPYALHGRSSSQLIRQTQQFVCRIEAEGLTTGVGHDLTLMARELGRDVRAFRDECRRIFLTGDVDRAEQLVADVNRALRRPAGAPARGAGPFRCAADERIASSLKPQADRFVATG